jgi:spermidine synthase
MLLGLIYPRLLVSDRLQGEGNAHLAGYISGANSLGCLTGALLGIFFFIPVLGAETSLKVIVLMLAAFWLLFLRQEPGSRRRLRVALPMVLLAAVLTSQFHWNWWTLNSGRGNYFGAAPEPASAVAGPQIHILPGPMLFRHEDSQGGITMVVEPTIVAPHYTQAVRTLLTNGKFQGDNNPVGEVNAQFGFAAVPSLFVDRCDRVLLIGLGTGHSATALRRLGYRSIHIAEFAAGIVQAARQYFSTLNEGILNDPKVHLHLEDGRNVLLTDPERKYDLITIEITSVWFAGATNLYSREFYELAKRHLQPGGVLQQWVQIHHTSPREIAADLATARSVFPHVSLWFYGGQGMLIASEHPLVLSGSAAARFRGFGMAPDAAGRLVSSLWDARLLGDDGAAALIRDVRPPINTDDNRWLEYASPRYQASSFNWIEYNLRFLAKYR